tara:strand:+ start:2722 stop:3252 length:531 start_codon:yes stop_codon:yes gene_type:complete
MNKLKTINIKGKQYVEVNERLKYFRANFKDYSLTSEITHIDSNMCVVKSEIVSPDGRVVASGHAHEIQSSSYINKTSYVENCETSSWGRCLGNFGIGIDSSVASADEVSMAITKQEKSNAITKKKMTAKIFEAMLKSITDGNPDLVQKHMHKYDMTEAQRKELDKNFESLKDKLKN